MHAAIHADVIGSRRLAEPETLAPALDRALDELNAVFAPGLVRPFALVDDDAPAGVLADAVQAPLCVSLLRELVAPLQVRVGVALDGAAEEAFVAALRADRLVHYRGTGAAGDLLLNAFCGLVEPLVRARDAAEWAAVRTVRRHATRGAAAESLGIAVAELELRLASGHWREVEDADAAIAAYLALALAG
jgi:hypothetical protein